MDNWIYDLLELPAECQVEEGLPNQFLSANFNLSSGEKNLLNYGIEAMSIVGAIGPDFGGVPAYQDDEQTMESVAVLLVDTKGGKFAKEVKKVADMLQKHLPQYLLIGLSDGENACISIASKHTTQDGLEVKESYLSPLISPDDLLTLRDAFSFENIEKDNLKTLWDNYCQVVKEME